METTARQDANRNLQDAALLDLMRASLALADRATDRLNERAEYVSRFMLPGMAA